MRPDPTAAMTGSMSQSKWPGLLLALLGSIAFSGKAIIVKLAYRHELDAVTLIAYRMLLSVSALRQLHSLA